MYNSMLWFLLIGAVLPVIIYFLSMKFPSNKFLQKVWLILQDIQNESID